MKKTLRKLAILGLAPIAMVSALSVSSVAMAEDKKAEEAKAEPTALEKGKALAFDRKKGNCLACHMIVGGEMAGNIAPPLVAMAARYPDKAKLREQIWDAQIKNPDSMMPPFGKHKALTEDEIDLITDYILTL